MFGFRNFLEGFQLVKKLQKLVIENPFWRKLENRQFESNFINFCRLVNQKNFNFQQP